MLTTAKPSTPPTPTKTHFRYHYSNNAFQKLFQSTPRRTHSSAPTATATTTPPVAASEEAGENAGEAEDPTVAVHVRDFDGVRAKAEGAMMAEAVDEAAAGNAAATEGGASAATRAVYAGDRFKGRKERLATLDAIATPVVMSATFTFKNTAQCVMYNSGEYPSFEYGRYGNPTTRAAELKIAALDRAEDAVVSASGMNSVTTMMLALVPAGGHIITTTDCYRRTRQFVATVLPKMGIRMSVIDPADTAALEAAIASHNGADLYFSESPTNPLIRLVDVPAVVAICRKHSVLTCIDTTFTTPINYTPVTRGVDLVLHSGTKYLAGHNDVLCGALAGRADLIAKIRALQGVLGGVVDPHAAYLLLRGLKTLHLRVAQHNANATALAKFLSTHPKIAKVHHPSLHSHPDRAVALAEYAPGDAFGGVLSFELLGDGDAWSTETFEAAGRFVDGLTLAYIGPSLGGVESIVEQVCIMGYFDQPLSIRKGLGISNGLVRLSCGVEDTDDLVKDVARALENV